MLVEYESNNSGGGWWLNDKQWLALEAAGWTVEWGGSYFCHPTYSFGDSDRPPGKPEPHAKGEACHGHRRFDSLAEVNAHGEKGRWLGCAAKRAEKEFPSIADAVREWEAITKEDASDEGCNCCGAPHTFSTDDPREYASGEQVARLLLGGPSNYREALEEIARLKKERE